MLQMQKCISSLPQRLRDIFMMHTFDKVTPEQITETLGVSENNLWVSLYRSRMSLRECLDKNWFKQKGDC
jgi:RNA polymerase sigma-70 factor (ECF subfamily)